MSLKRNAAWNLAGTGLPLLLGAAAIPYLIKHIGVEAFGVLTLIWALIGYFSLFDFGLGRALTQQVASSLASGRIRTIPYVVKSGLTFTLITGIVGGVVLAALSSSLGYSWLKVSVPLQSQTAYSLLIAALGLPLTTVTAGMRGVLEAYEDFKAVNLFRIILGTTNFGLPILSVMVFGTSLQYIVATLIIARFFVFMAYWLRVNNKLATKWNKAKVQTKHVKRLLSFGAWMSVSNVLSPIMVSADRFLIAAVLGASAVAYYTVPFEVLIRVLVIPGALTGALFPRLAYTLKRDADTARALYRKSIRIIAITLTGLCSMIAVGSYWGLMVWLGHDFASKSWMIVSIMSLGILLNGIAFIPYAAIQATGNAKTTAFLHIGQLLAYVPLLFFFLHFWGLAGAAIAWVARAGLDLVLLLVYARKTAGVSLV